MLLSDARDSSVQLFWGESCISFNALLILGSFNAERKPSSGAACSKYALMILINIISDKHFSITLLPGLSLLSSSSIN